MGHSAEQHDGRHAARAIVGRASFYAYKGGKTASGAPFNAHALTAAHRTLPFGTRLRVTNLKTSKSVEVTVTDRGPVSRSRVLDLSLSAAKALGMNQDGVTKVRAEVIGG
jgi:rare lipoprotein A